MQEATHRVTVNFKNDVSVEYEAILMYGATKKNLSYARFSEFEGLIPDRGMLFVNLHENTVSFSYDIFSFDTQIAAKKKDGDTTIYECTAELSIVSVEIEKFRFILD